MFNFSSADQWGFSGSISCRTCGTVPSAASLWFSLAWLSASWLVGHSNLSGIDTSTCSQEIHMSIVFIQKSSSVFVVLVTLKVLWKRRRWPQEPSTLWWPTCCSSCQRSSEWSCVVSLPGRSGWVERWPPRERLTDMRFTDIMAAKTKVPVLILTCETTDTNNRHKKKAI